MIKEVGYGIDYCFFCAVFLGTEEEPVTRKKKKPQRELTDLCIIFRGVKTKLKGVIVMIILFAIILFCVYINLK